MSIRLWDTGRGIHALIYRAGIQVDDRSIVEGFEVFEPAAAEMGDAPATIPESLVVKGAKQFLEYTGLFMIPGHGLAAVFGAKSPGLEPTAHICRRTATELGLDIESDRSWAYFHKAMDDIRGQFRNAVHKGNAEPVGAEGLGMIAAIADEGWEIVGAAGDDDNRVYLCRTSTGAIYAVAHANGARGLMLKRA